MSTLASARPRALAALVALALLVAAAAGQDVEEAAEADRATEGGISRAPQVALYAGCLGVLDDDVWTTVRAEYRWAPQWWDVRPIAGANYAEDDNYYVYGGLRRDFPLWGQLEFSPSWSFGIYEDGTVDLGHAVEFRTGFDLTYPLSERSRAGLGFYHLSNASLAVDNPGTETLVLSVTWDL